MLAVHIWSQFFDYILGGICLLLFIFLYKRVNRGINSEMSTETQQDRDATTANVAKPSYLSIFIACCIFLSGGALLANELRQNMKHGAVSAPAQGVDISNQFISEYKKSQQQLSKLKGFAVWSSNRFGNHDIVRMDLSTMQIDRLTDNSHACLVVRRLSLKS